MLSIPGLVSHYTNLDDALRSDAPVAYVFGSNGIMVIHRTPFGRFGVRAGDVSVPGLAELPPYLIEWSVPRIPFTLFVSAVNTLKAAYEKHKCESLVFICYDNGYFLHVPPQEVTSASVHYELDIPSEQVVMHIHSHPGTLDHFSGVDDRDELNAGFYTVLSNMNTAWPAATVSLCVAGHRALLSTPGDINQVLAVPDSAQPLYTGLDRIRQKPISVPRLNRHHLAGHWDEFSAPYSYADVLADSLDPDYPWGEVR